MRGLAADDTQMLQSSRTTSLLLSRLPCIALICAIGAVACPAHAETEPLGGQPAAIEQKWLDPAVRRAE